VNRLKAKGLNQARIGRNSVAFFDEHDVTGHQLARKDIQLFPLRRTRARAGSNSRNASMARSAWYS
jgi:hypothetical protein